MTRFSQISCFIVLVSSFCGGGCATTKPSSSLDSSKHATTIASPEREEEEFASKGKLPNDEEDTVIQHLLAIPEYLWKGLAYPVKKMSIFYEKVDLLERALDVFLNEERTGGTFPRFEFGGALGNGIGFTAFHNNLFNQKKQIRASYLFGIPENHAGELFFKDPDLFGSSFNLESNLLGLDVDQGRFFPGGNQSAKKKDGGRTNFELDEISWDLNVGRSLIGDFSSFIKGRVFHANAKEGRGSDIPSNIPGVRSALTALEIGPEFKYDSRDSPFRPSTGVLFEGTFSYTEQVNGKEFRYIGYTGEVQWYIPVFRENRVLLLRGYLAKLDSLNDRAIPFYEFNFLDLNHGLRGYERGRFSDEGALLFNLEWRYPVWEQIEGSFFIDEGQVFNDFRDLNIRTFRTSIGAGFRFVSKQNFTFRVHLAGSEDGLQLVLKGDLEFIRQRGTFLGGL